MPQERLRHRLAALPQRGEAPSGNTVDLYSLLIDAKIGEAEIINGLNLADVQGVMAQETGLIIPDVLVATMNLEIYPWSHIAATDSNNLPLLFVMGARDRFRPYDDALATLVIERGISERDGKIFPRCVRLAASMTDNAYQTNAVGITYNVPLNRAYWVDIVGWGNGGNLNNRFPATPSNYNMSAGLITDAMIRAIPSGRKSIHFEFYDSTHSGTSIKQYRGLGACRISSTDEFHEISFGPQRLTQRHLSIPTGLSRV